MNQHAPQQIRRPRTDDRPLWDILLGLWGYPAVFVAYDLKLFPLLAEQPRTLPEICEALKIARRPSEALLTVCVSLGLVQVQDGRYSLTPLSEDYLLESSPTSFGGYMDLMIANYSVWSFESVKKAVLTDSPQAYGECLKSCFRGAPGCSMRPALVRGERPC